MAGSGYLSSNHKTYLFPNFEQNAYTAPKPLTRDWDFFMEKFKSAQVAYQDYYGMLSDSIRMNAFSQAIKKVVKAGDVVLDPMCGSGMVGAEAVPLGRRFIGIDRSIDYVKEVHGTISRRFFS